MTGKIHLNTRRLTKELTMGLTLALTLAVAGCSAKVSGTTDIVPNIREVAADATGGKATLKPGKSSNSKMVTHAGSGSSPYIRKLPGKHTLGVLDAKSSGYIITKK